MEPSESANSPRCFQAWWAQLMHKYATFLLVIVIGMLSWWLVHLDARTTKNTEAFSALKAETNMVQEHQQAVLRSLHDIRVQIITLDNRIYILMGRKTQGDGGIIP